ncbi:DUF3467 domain-containing protein [bacterium]|nr:DUF3467 domain-containing protein [bacterium]
MDKKPQQQRIAIDLGEKEAEGVYSNLSLVSHSQAEFILDFARIVPGVPKAKVHARVIMTPMAMKALQANLKANIERYEAVHGEIKASGQPQLPPIVGFDTEN